MNPDNLTPSQINVTIAELCGWTKIRTIIGTYGESPDGTRKSIPNYHGSLDAMATAEATLTSGEDSEIYAKCLAQVVLKLSPSDTITLNYWALKRIACATARQRAIAFLHFNILTKS